MPTLPSRPDDQPSPQSPLELFGPLRLFGQNGWPRSPIVLPPALIARPEDEEWMPDELPASPVRSPPVFSPHSSSRSPWNFLAQLCAAVPGGAIPSSQVDGLWRAVPDAHSWLRAWGGNPTSHRLVAQLMKATVQQAWLRHDGLPYVFAVGEDEEDVDPSEDERSEKQKVLDRIEEADQAAQAADVLKDLWAKAHPRDAVLLAAWVGMLGSCSAGMMLQSSQNDWWNVSTPGDGATMFSVDRIEVTRIWSSWCQQSDSSANAPYSGDWLIAAAWAGAALISPSERTCLKGVTCLSATGDILSVDPELFEFWEAIDLPQPVRVEALRYRSVILDDQLARGAKFIGSVLPTTISDLARQARAVWEREVLRQMPPRASGADPASSARSTLVPVSSARPRRI